MSKKKEEGKKVFKVITIGDSDVGKTSIIRRYISGIFDPNTMSTIGLNFSLKEITLKHKVKINLKIVDTAGQEKHKSLTKSYFKNSDAVLFVFDINKKESFESINEWIKIFEENNNRNKIPKYLIGNKSDKVNEISQDMVDKFLNEHNEFKYVKTSALKNENIEKLFKDISEDIWENFINSYQGEQKTQLIKQYTEQKNIKILVSALCNILL